MSTSKGLTVGLYGKPKPTSGRGFANAYAPLTAEEQKKYNSPHYYLDSNTGVWYEGTKTGDTYQYSEMDPNAPDFSDKLQGSVVNGFDVATGTFDTEDNARGAGYNPNDYMQQTPGAFGVQQWKSSVVKDSPTYTDFSAQTAAQVQRNARDFTKNAKKYSKKLVQEAYDWRALKGLGMNYAQRQEYLRNLKNAYTNKKAENSYVNQATNYAANYAENYKNAYNEWRKNNASNAAEAEATKYNAQEAAGSGTTAQAGSGTNNALRTNSQPITWSTNVGVTPAFPAAPTFQPYKQRFGGALNYARIFQG